jgi:hypothetical protein
VDNSHDVQICSNEQLRVSGYISDCLVVLSAGAVCKNRDELIYFIDRVSGAYFWSGNCQSFHFHYYPFIGIPLYKYKIAIMEKSTNNFTR